ncbi:alpha/beta fold hydrolase [Sphingobacterium psychroaquaticum]|nr:alpha/beta hydrolase [Sphingobacterium psychroaquaticum]
MCYYRNLLLFFLILFSTITAAQEVKKTTVFRSYASAVAQYNLYEQKHRKRKQTAHVKLAYLEWGKPGDKAFIWLHGSLSNAYEFMPFAERIAQAGYHVIAIDQYNAGKTPLPPFDASFDDLCVDIKDLMENLGIKKAVIGGFSRGAFLATNFYKQYPNSVSGLILEDGGSVAFKTSYEKLSKTALAAKLKSVNLPDEIKNKYFAEFSSKFQAYKSLFEPETKTNQFEILSYIKPLKNKWITYKGLPEYYYMQDSLHMAKALFQTSTISKYAASIINVDPVKIFQNLSTPVLIMDANSTTDPTPVLAENKTLAASHPKYIQLKAFENVDHNIHFAYPDEFVKTITEFLKKFNI